VKYSDPSGYDPSKFELPTSGKWIANPYNPKDGKTVIRSTLDVLHYDTPSKSFNVCITVMNVSEKDLDVDFTVRLATPSGPLGNIRAISRKMI